MLCTLLCGVPFFTGRLSSCTRSFLYSAFSGTLSSSVAAALRYGLRVAVSSSENHGRMFGCLSATEKALSSPPFLRFLGVLLSVIKCSRAFRNALRHRVVLVAVSPGILQIPACLKTAERVRHGRSAVFSCFSVYLARSLASNTAQFRCRKRALARRGACSFLGAYLGIPPLSQGKRQDTQPSRPAEHHAAYGGSALA